jgi:hypothetical protein
MIELVRMASASPPATLRRAPAAASEANDAGETIQWLDATLVGVESSGAVF